LCVCVRGKEEQITNGRKRSSSNKGSWEQEKGESRGEAIVSGRKCNKSLMDRTSVMTSCVKASPHSQRHNRESDMGMNDWRKKL